jgi:4-amino-4-deoxy-L-arabinose transferase-like glycosyltransferase
VFDLFSKFRRALSRLSFDEVILLVLVAAAVVFGLVVALRLPVIENEGAEYATIARNLHRGLGYVGLHGTPEVYFPPAFPFGIAFIGFFIQDLVLSGRLVALLAGAIAAIMAGLLAARWSGRRAGLLTAVIALGMPLMIGISTAVLSETTYMACAVAGILLIWRAFEKGTTGAFIAAGVVMGLAHLTKPEVMIYATLLIALRFLALRSTQPRLAFRIPWFFVVYALVIAPYAVFLHGHTGKWMVEGKSGLNSAIAIRTSQGETLDEACRLLGTSTRAPGLLLHPMDEVPKYSGPALVLEHPTTPFLNIWHNSAPLLRSLTRNYGYFILILATIGFVSLYRRSRQQFLFLATAIVFPLLLVSSFWIFSRYVVVILPMLAIAAAHGLLEVAGWARLVAPRLAARPGFVALLACLTVAVTMTLWPNIHGRRAAFNQSHQVEFKQVGRWLADNGATGRKVMSLSTAIPFYADATWLTLPLGRSDSTLQYARHYNAAFVVMRTDSSSDRFYTSLPDWQIVHRDSSNPANRLVVLAPVSLRASR